MNMKKILIGERGVSLITAIMLLLLLSVLGLAVVSLVMVESQISVNQLYSLQAFSLAEAGIERGIRAIRDDTIANQFTDPAAAGYCVTPSLDGYSADGSNGSNYERTLFYGTILTNTTAYSCTLYATAGANVQVYDFQQRYNLLGTPIIGMEIGIRAIKSGTGTADPIVQLQYTLNGSWTSPTNVGSPITVSATSFGAPVFTTMSVTPTWNDLMAAGGSNFRIRAYRNNAEGYYLEIDYLCIRVMLKADCSSEPWFTTFKLSDGTPITVNIALGNGVIETMPIDDEAGKVHLNYATQALLRYLMVECGIADATANTLATNIVTYRGSNWFDSIEEVMQVTGMTSTYYNLIKDYITVYSSVNTNVQIPTGSRAPININTAPLQVLKAVFDPLGLGATDPASLASAIITQRTGTTGCLPVPPNPFSSMISSNPADSSSSFARFLDTQTSYLTAAEIDAIKENCDASYYNETQTSSWTGGSVTTTEFCYSSNVYSVTARGKVENSYRQVKRVFKDDGTFNISAVWGPILNYWREIVP
jgi:hypothetical protein